MVTVSKKLAADVSSSAPAFGLVLLALLQCGCLFGLEQPHQASAEPVQESATVPNYRSHVRTVLVPVVVLNDDGSSVGGLTKDDFQIFDKGKLQKLSSFTPLSRSTSGGADRTSGLTTNLAHASAAGELSGDQVTRRIMLLFDDLHLSPADYVGVRGAASTVVDSFMGPTERMAVLTTSTRTNTGFTSDKTLLKKAIANLKSPPEFLQTQQSCPHIDHYLAYLIHDLHSQAALDAVTADVVRCISPTDPVGADPFLSQQMARSAAASEMIDGERLTYNALNIISQAVSQMGTLPGRRLLVLISSGFLAVTKEADSWKTQVIDRAAQLNVVVNAFDARGLYTDMPDSSIRIESRAESSMHAESAAIYDNAPRELATGTGGIFVRNSNDFKRGLARLVSDPKFSYLLSFTPSQEPDRTFHKLKVKVARTGTKGARN